MISCVRSTKVRPPLRRIAPAFVFVSGHGVPLLRNVDQLLLDKGIARLEGLGGLDKVPWRNSPNSATLATETAGVHTANKHLAPPPRGFSLRAFNALEEPDLSPRGRN
jgi:hypothetical protein